MSGIFGSIHTYHDDLSAEVGLNGFVDQHLFLQFFQVANFYET